MEWDEQREEVRGDAGRDQQADMTLQEAEGGTKEPQPALKEQTSGQNSEEQTSDLMSRGERADQKLVEHSIHTSSLEEENITS